MALDPLQVALWRYDHIAALLPHYHNNKNHQSILKDLTKNGVKWPSGTVRHLARSTIYSWRKKFLEHNQSIDALFPLQRTTIHEGVIKNEWLLFALGLLEEQSDRSLFFLCKQIHLHFNLPTPPSRSSLHRALCKEKRYHLARSTKRKQFRTRFTATVIHQIWHGDAKADFTVTFTDGTIKKYRVLSILDDCSRFIVASLIVQSESTTAAVKTFFNAAIRYGLPLSFYADRGSAYDSDIFRQGLALLGVHRIFTKPANPSAHGKIEAFHRSLERYFIKELPLQRIKDEMHLQVLLEAVVSTLYHQHPHRELKKTPHQAFNNTLSQRFVSMDRLREAFFEYHLILPEKKTGSVRLHALLFKIPHAYLIPRKQVKCAIDLLDLDNAYLVTNQNKFIKLSPAIKKIPAPKVNLNPVDPLQFPGPLTPLLESYQGRTLPIAQPGFGLPEIYSILSHSLNRLVPQTESEAMMVADWIKKWGPFNNQNFIAVLNSTLKRIGHSRPLMLILTEIVKTYNKDSQHDCSNQHPFSLS